MYISNVVYISCCVYIVHRPYDINPSVQLVCKYLRAYKNQADLSQGINRLFTDNSKNYMYQSCVYLVMHVRSTRQVW